MQIVCLDLEGVLVPEIWIAFSERTGIAELRRTTRDEPDYDKLMKYRLDLLKHHRLGLPDIQKVIADMGPMAGAKDFLDALRVQRWDDHRYYHHSKVNQSLHFVSAISFLVAYVMLFTSPAIAAVIGCLFAISKLTRALSSPQLAKVIYIAFFLGTFTLGYKLYADHLVSGFIGIKQKMITMFAKAQQREGLATPKPRPGQEGEP